VHDLRLAELLSKYRLPATFYIARQHEYGSLPEREILELGRSFEVGAHTLNHVILDSAADDLAANEIRGSRSWIEQISGHSCPMFCFPRGKFSRRHISMVREAGFKGVRTVELMSRATPRPRCGVVVMPTTIQAFPHKRSVYIKNICRRHRFGNLESYLHANGAHWTAVARSLLNWIASCGGVFHLWGHAWEIEQFSLWHDVEDLFRSADEYRSLGKYVNNSELCTGAVV